MMANIAVERDAPKRALPARSAPLTLNVRNSAWKGGKVRDPRQRTLSAMGAVVAVAAFEHGLGEFLQGPVAPASVFIQSYNP